MDIKEIVADWLKAHGYTGLFAEDECGCSVEDGLMPCDEVCWHRCEAGYKVPCTSDCDHDFPYEEGNWHVQAEKPLPSPPGGGE